MQNPSKRQGDEGGGIVGGGIEFLMMTLMGDYNGGTSEDPYAVTAHMWIPMQLASNERRYAWMGEGTTTFNENQAKKAFFNNAQSQESADLNDFESYLGITGTDLEGEIMRWPDYHYNGSAYGVASYHKPASVLVALRGLLGEQIIYQCVSYVNGTLAVQAPLPLGSF